LIYATSSFFGRLTEYVVASAPVSLKLFDIGSQTIDLALRIFYTGMTAQVTAFCNSSNSFSTPQLQILPPGIE